MKTGGAWFPVTPLHFVWQAWDLVTPTSILCGRRGTCGTGLALVARLVPGDAVPFCVAIVALGCAAGVALGDPDLHFCVAGVAHVALADCVAGLGLHLVTTTFILCGRRGTCGTGLALVARLVPGDAVTRLHFV